MCGIIGISGPINIAALQAGTRAIAHRGPDDSGLFVDEAAQIGLGHTRLSIVELSALGHQPMLSDDGKFALIFNGEIYNFRELRRGLEDLGHTFRGQSDTEVVLHLYIEHGQAMLSRLNGIFAMGLWDASKQSLLLARDALGVKPLYVHQGESSFCFASEIKALQCLMPPLSRLNHAAIHRYLSFQWCPGAETPSSDVFKLGPGEAIWVSKGRIAERFNWYRLPIADRSFTSRLSEADAIAGVKTHVKEAVHRQMIADVPVGAFLSGGLDSSSVVAFAREINPNIQCFTIEAAGGQDAGMVDDLAYAKKVADHLKVPLEIVYVDSSRMANDLEQMICMLEEPLADPAPLNVLYISRLAREQGYKVLLSGAGGDDVFSGYRRHLALKTEPYWSWLPKTVRSGVGRLTHRLDQRNSLLRKITKGLSGIALDGDARLVNYFLWAKREDLFALYTPDFKTELGDAEAATPLLDFLNELTNATALDRMLALEQRFFLPDHNLTYTDKMSMAVGVEVRVPLLDLELLEFAANIPDDIKQRGFENKWVFKKAMEPFLPRDVIYRPKTGFGAPLRRWLRHELKELVHDTLSPAQLKKRNIFDSNAVQRLILANESGKIDASYTLLSILCIEIWCNTFLRPSAQI
jgi:asparagine synthase (glutamine-hydrolysing)